MGKLIQFPMSLQMVKRVNQNLSYERALKVALALKDSKEVQRKSRKIKAEADQFLVDLQRLIK